MGGWVSEFWASGLMCMLILIISMYTVYLTQFGQKSRLSEFLEKKTNNNNNKTHSSIGWREPCYMGTLKQQVT